MQILDVLKTILLVMVVLTFLIYLYQVAYLFIPFILKKKKLPHKPLKQTRYAILIAARNEEAVIAHLLDSIRAQDYPAELVTTYVVADNCTNRTADLAADHGATVYRRFNKKVVGKGHALHYLLDQIQRDGGLDRYDAFLIFDADNLLPCDYISKINQTCSDGYEAFCGYRNSKNFGDNWISSGQAIYYLHESTHLNQSRMLIGTCCAVSGTGFGFTRELLRRMGSWNFFTLTEDIEFTVWCATRGITIGYCHDAIVYDEQPTRFPQSWKQRTRWAQGGLQVSFRYFKDLMRGILKGGRTGYSSYEMTTLTMWGCISAVVSVVLSLVIAVLSGQWLGLLGALLFGLVVSYFTVFFLGALTLATEWNRVHTSCWKKIRAMLTYPLFMYTFLPITLTAGLRKFQWEPIDHTVAISAAELARK